MAWDPEPEGHLMAYRSLRLTSTGNPGLAFTVEALRGGVASCPLALYIGNLADSLLGINDHWVFNRTSAWTFDIASDDGMLPRKYFSHTSCCPARPGAVSCTGAYPLRERSRLFRSVPLQSCLPFTAAFHFVHGALSAVRHPLFNGCARWFLERFARDSRVPRIGAWTSVGAGLSLRPRREL